MKNIAAFIAVLLISVSCSEKNNVKIKGNIQGAAKQKVYLEQINVDNRVIIDSCQTNKNGKFSFKTRVTLPTFFNVKIGPKEFVTLIALPDEEIELSGNYQHLSHNYWVDGSENSLWIKLLNFQLQQTQEQMDSLRKAYAAVPANALYASERQRISGRWDSLLNKQMDFSREFILKHAISPAAYYALYQKFDADNFILTPEQDLQSYKIVASSLKAMYPESQYTQAILKHLSQINKELQTQKLRDLIANTESSLPNIRMANVQGDTIALNELKGKYIILDFTVLNTKEGISYLRELKEIYHRYHSKGVRIYQVCLDPNKLAWEKLVKQYDIPWICVRDPEGLQSRTAKIWNIQTVPANYIISPSSEIVGKNLSGRRLEERLNDLLK